MTNDEIGVSGINGLVLWARKTLSLAGDVKVILEHSFIDSGTGRAHMDALGDHWVKVRFNLSRKFDKHPKDPRMDEEHWKKTGDGAFPLRSRLELFLFVLGHEMWHHMYWTKAEKKMIIGFRQQYDMEAECDEAGWRLVNASRSTVRPWRVMAAEARRVKRNAKRARSIPSGLAAKMRMMQDIDKRGI